MNTTMKPSSLLTLIATSALFFAASIAEAQTCDWRSPAPMPTARFALKSVTVDGKIYAMGGLTDANEGVAHAEVEAYDPVTNTWEAREPMAEPAFYFGLDAIDRLIYRVGGVEGNAPTDRVAAYDIDADTWTELEPLPVASAYLTATALDGKLYAVGGAMNEGGNYVPLSLVHRYDPVANEWTEMAPLPIARHAHGAAVAHGKLYIVGGLEEDGDSFRITNTVSVYDPVTNAWSDAVSAITRRAYPGVASLGGMLYIAGGFDFTEEDEAPTDSGDLHRFDPGAGSWTRLHDLPSQRLMPSASFVGDMLYVMGGALSDAPVADVDALPVLAKSGLLHRTQSEAPGANCAAGGTRLDNGFDTNCNGELDDGDILETAYLCHGEDGAPASDVIVESKDEPSGDNCPEGGVRIDAGYDTDGDGKLSTEEVEKTTFICHGAKGPGGADGSAGVDGVDGKDGEAGAEGGCAMARGTARDGSLLALGASALIFFGLRRRRDARA